MNHPNDIQLDAVLSLRGVSKKIGNKKNRGSAIV